MTLANQITLLRLLLIPFFGLLIFFYSQGQEWIRFLAPYGRFRAYRLPDGSPVPFDHKPSLEDSIAQDQMIIGSPEECADVIGRYRDEVGVEHFVMFFDMPGLTREQMDEQLELTATDVLPKLGVTLDGPAAPPTDWVLPT